MILRKGNSIACCYPTAGCDEHEQQRPRRHVFARCFVCSWAVMHARSGVGEPLLFTRVRVPSRCACCARTHHVVRTSRL